MELPKNLKDAQNLASSIQSIRSAKEILVHQYKNLVEDLDGFSEMIPKADQKTYGYALGEICSLLRILDLNLDVLRTKLSEGDSWEDIRETL